MSVFQKILKAGEGKRAKQLAELVGPINELSGEMAGLTDAELRAKTEVFKERLAEGETLDDLLIEAFAAVPGNHFTYAWNITAGTAEPGRTEFDTYPGNAYVSSIGIDVYDEWGMDSNLPAIASFAHSVAKPISLDEWGLNGSDDPGFISTVAAFINNPANDVTLQSYFNYGTHAITQFPGSEAQYVMDFAGC